MADGADEAAAVAKSLAGRGRYPVNKTAMFPSILLRVYYADVGL
jgi:hypothetical protein